MINSRTHKLYSFEHYDNQIRSISTKAITLKKAVVALLFLTGLFINMSSASAGVIAPAPAMQSIDCSWSGNYVNCTINEPQGIGNVLIYTVLEGEPWWQLLENTDCETTTSFGVHADGPSSLMIDVKPCGSQSKTLGYRYLPTGSKTSSEKTSALMVPSIDPAQTLRGLVEESKRMRRFMDIEMKKNGVRGAGGADSLTTSNTFDEYKCDNNPPQTGDNCTCGGKGSPIGNQLDCAILQIDCKSGNFDKNENSCSSWEGDPWPFPNP